MSNDAVKIVDGNGVYWPSRSKDMWGKCAPNPEWADIIEDEYKLCLEWLLKPENAIKVRKEVSSYGLKHTIERDIGHYVSNGACIAAAIHAGYQVTIHYKGYQNLNVWIKTGADNPLLCKR